MKNSTRGELVEPCELWVSVVNTLQSKPGRAKNIEARSRYIIAAVTPGLVTLAHR